MRLSKSYALVFSFLLAGYEFSEAHPADRSRTDSSKKPNDPSPMKTCLVYNGTVCDEYLKGKSVQLLNEKSLLYSEQKLKKWFRYAQVTALVSRDCWPHAVAIACFAHFTECHQDGGGQSQEKPLCSAHCTFLNEHLCQQEYKMARYSKKLREFLPKCEQVPLVDDTDGQNCMYLPSLKLNEAPEPIAEKPRNIQLAIGKTALIKCYFGIRNFVWRPSMKQKYGLDARWYKDGQLLVPRNRFSVSTQQKGKSRILMLLKIGNTKKSDTGSYRCMLTFANKTVIATSKLHVYESSNGFHKEITPNADNSTILSVVSSGSCKPYVGELCSKYLAVEEGELLIYENVKNPQHVLERQLTNVMSMLVQSRRLSERCREFGRAVLCHSRFDRCSNTTGHPVRTLCKQDCLLFESEFCKEESKLFYTAGGLARLLVPDCTKLLHSNPNCIPIHKSTLQVKGEEGLRPPETKESGSPPHSTVDIDASEISESEGLVIYIIPSVLGIAILILSAALLIMHIKSTRYFSLPSNSQVVSEEIGTLSSTATADPSLAPEAPRRVVPWTSHLNPVGRVQEIKRDRLGFGSKISGVDSSELWRGEFRDSRQSSLPVLIEMLTPDAPVCLIARFRQKMLLLQKLDHDNVQKLLCISIIGEVPFMAFQHDPGVLNLQQFLSDNLSKFRCCDGLSNAGLDFLIDLMHQVASGLQYLHVNNTCHQDIAMHNCLITSNCKVVLSMTTLSRQQYPTHYIEVSSFGVLPVRWLPSDTLLSGNFTCITDLHMFGVLLWEMFSHRRIPYHEVPDNEVVDFIVGGGRLPCPKDCPDAIYGLIQECTSTEPHKRPTVDKALEIVSNWMKSRELIFT